MTSEATVHVILRCSRSLRGDQPSCSRPSQCTLFNPLVCSTSYNHGNIIPQCTFRLAKSTCHLHLKTASQHTELPMAITTSTVVLVAITNMNGEWFRIESC